MMPYIVLWLIVFLLSFKIKEKKWNIFDFLILIILIVFSAIRYGIGVDYELYERIFNNITSLELMNTNRTGLGFSYIMYFIHSVLKGDYQLVIAGCSIITNLFMYIFIKRNCSRPGLGILLYLSLGFYTTSFNMFRQMLSMSIILIGFECFKSKKKLLTLIFFIIGFFIHSTSSIAILAYIILLKFKNLKLNTKLLLACSAIGVVLYDKIFYAIISLIPSLSMYIENSYAPGIGTYLNVLVYLIILFLIMTRKKDFIDKNKNNILYLNSVIIGVAIMLFELKNYLFFRIAFYFIIFMPIALTEYYEISNFRKKKIESLVFYVCLLTYFIIYINSFDGVIPYTTIIGR